MTPMRRAAFLDRDGTIVVEKGYILSPDDAVLLPGAAAAIRRLRDAGFLIIVVSNQSAVARGLMAWERLEEVNARIRDHLAREGVILDGIYCCPHHPEGVVEAYRLACDCRKPGPALLLRAAREHDVDLRASFMVGDSPRDIAAGRAAGCAAIRVKTGVWEDRPGNPAPDFMADDLPAAAGWILEPKR